MGTVPKSHGKDQWAARTLRSGFGRQVTSSLSTAPACGFGSSIREAAARQYVSPDVDKANCKARGGSNSQGAIYKTADALGKQVLSTMETAAQVQFGTGKRPSMATKSSVPGPGAYKTKPSIGNQFLSTMESPAKVRFGTSTRDQADKLFLSLEHEKSTYGRGSPGPSAYNVSGGMGKQMLSDKASLPQWSMGAEQRFNYTFVKTAETSPGAGQYKVPGSVGKQLISTKKSTPTIRFGSSTRDQMKKMFISVDHEKSNYGEGSPGPTTANPSKGIGEQVLSSTKTAPAFGFGTGRRLAPYGSDTPGPGEYYA